MISLPSMVLSSLANSKFSKMDNPEVLDTFNLRPRRVPRSLSKNSTTATNMERRLRFNIMSKKVIEKNKEKNIPTFSFKIFRMISLITNSRKFSPHSEILFPRKLMQRKMEQALLASRPMSMLRLPLREPT